MIKSIAINLTNDPSQLVTNCSQLENTTGKKVVTKLNAKKLKEIGNNEEGEK